MTAGAATGQLADLTSATLGSLLHSGSRNQPSAQQQGGYSMLNLWGKRQRSDCEGTSRRDFLKLGTLGLPGLSLSGLLRQRAAAAAAGKAVKDTSVVWLWLSGGASQIETFDPKMDAPAEYRSMVGAVQTSLPGVQIGGLFPSMAQRAHRMALVRSFAHSNSGHLGATHYVMTGWENPLAVPDSGAPPIKPSMGSITARVRGANHPTTGMPTYVRLRELYAEGPHWLGSAYAPFNAAGQARNNMNLSMDLSRLSDRRGLLKKFDVLNREIHQRGLMSGLDAFEQQAFDLILGGAKEAFDLQREDPRVRDQYGRGGWAARLAWGSTCCWRAAYVKPAVALLRLTTPIRSRAGTCTATCCPNSSRPAHQWTGPSALSSTTWSSGACPRKSCW